MADIDEEIRQEYRRIYGKAEAESEPEKEVAAEPEQVSEETATEPETDGRARGEDGKFVAKAKEPEAPDLAPQAKSSPKEAEKVDPAPAPEPKQDVVRDINRAPSSWKPAAKASWANLPPDTRAEIHRREADFLKGQSGLLPDAELGRSMRQVIDPYRVLIDSEGGTPERAVSDLLRTAALFRMGSTEQKQAALFQIARQYGIPLPQAQQAQDGQQNAAPQQFNDPRVDVLLQQLQAQEIARQSANQREVEGVAANWLNEADANGNPLRPYIDNVMDGMNVRVPAIRASDPSLSHKEVLQRAYEQEIWANPEIRSLLIKEQSQQLEAKSRTENQERVNLARKASSVNVSRRASSGTTPAKPVSLDDTIRETARALGMITN